MASLNSNTFLSTLIKTGADASLNLFSIKFKPQSSTDNNNVLSARTTQFTSPKRDVKSTDFAYQNIKISKIVASSEIEKKMKISIRIDDNYNVLDYLKKHLSIDYLGNFKENPDNKFTITVDALKPVNGMSEDNYKSVYRWEFLDAYILDIGVFSYNYNSAESISVPVDFIYSLCVEYSESEII